MKLLVFNTGSSSVKYKLFEMTGGEVVLASGVLDRIGEAASGLVHRWRAADGRFAERITEHAVPDHRRAFGLIGETMAASGVLADPETLDGIGHRVVHGGERFSEPALITNEVIAAIREMIPLAPLHNPASLDGVEAALEFAPNVPQIAVFDTVFHRTLRPHAYLYAIPRDFYTRLHVRRYGFHGISNQYLVREAARLLGRDEDAINLISLHLGNGASVTAVKNGRSVDTSMGMTPLEGLVMGTRCGDLDPSIPFYLEKWAGLTAAQVDARLNQDSGLKGLCGASDMRTIQQLAESGDEPACQAIDLFCYRIRKYIGAYVAVLGRVDALVFTGGIGENSSLIRKQCCQDLEHLGFALDSARNTDFEGEAMEVQAAGSASRILMIRSNEELEIARQAMTCIARLNTA